MKSVLPSKYLDVLRPPETITQCFLILTELAIDKIMTF